jgi:hypoxanthine-guanine phosphoribosyltransferase
MLGDVVGLGKTLTAVATALMLQAAEDYSTLVLCPKNLETDVARAPRGLRG